MYSVYTIKYRVRVGAKLRFGLKGKIGENPTLSRNCISERFAKYHCLYREGAIRVEDEPGDLPISSTHQIPTWK